MKEHFLRKKFIFNDKINGEFLFSLYEDDFLYIEEIFKTTLDQLNTVIPEIPTAFNGNDVSGLRKIVHKIKPAFGFTGFLETEERCKEFEDICASAKADDLTTAYAPFWALLKESMDIMQNQHAQLKEFNNL
jgi:HPt (histidine-containing phosphotransfer) domain-containing protein